MHRDDGPYKPVTGRRRRPRCRAAGWPARGRLDHRRRAAPRTGSSPRAPRESASAIGLDILSLIPTAGVASVLRRIGARPFEQLAVTRARDAVDKARITADAVELFESDDGDLPPGMRAGDVVVAWPVHRTAGATAGPTPLRESTATAFGSVRLIRTTCTWSSCDPRRRGLAVIAQRASAALASSRTGSDCAPHTARE